MLLREGMLIATCKGNTRVNGMRVGWATGGGGGGEVEERGATEPPSTERYPLEGEGEGGGMEANNGVPRKGRLSARERKTRENGRSGGWDVRYLQRNAEHAQEEDEGEREKGRMGRGIFAKDG